jgi:hypothetical protein
MECHDHSCPARHRIAAECAGALFGQETAAGVGEKARPGTQASPEPGTTLSAHAENQRPPYNSLNAGILGRAETEEVRA